jgi:hypothetical protein
LFRVETAQDAVQITAMRVVVDGRDLVFENPRGQGVWDVQHRIPAAEVVKLTRRVTEVTGAIAWVVHRPATTALNLL